MKRGRASGAAAQLREGRDAGHLQARFHGAHARPRQLGHARQRECAAQDEDLRLVDELRRRQVQRRPWLRQLAVARRPHDSHDRSPHLLRVGSAELEPLAERVLPRPGARGEILAHDRDLGRARAIVARESAPLQQRHRERREVAGVNGFQVDRRVLSTLSRPWPSAVNTGRSQPPVPANGRVWTGVAPSIPGAASSCATTSSMERLRAGPAAPGRGQRRQLDEHEPVRGQAHLGPLEPQQAAHQQPGGRHDRHRQRDLRHDQHAPAAPRARAAPAARAPWSCAARSIRLRQRDRCDPRERGGQEHDAEREEHHQRIGAHRLEPRQAARHERHHGPQQEAAGGECEERRPGARAAGSRRAAGAPAGRDPRRASPASRARGASSRRAAAAGSRRSRSRSAAPARRRRTARASRGARRPPRRPRTSARPAACRGGSPADASASSRATQPRARSSPARASRPAAAGRRDRRRGDALAEGRVHLDRGIGRERHPGLDAARIRDVRWHHAHDRERLVADRQPAPEDVARAAVAALPERVRDHEHVLSAARRRRGAACGRAAARRRALRRRRRSPPRRCR